MLCMILSQHETQKPAGDSQLKRTLSVVTYTIQYKYVNNAKQLSVL